MPEVWYLTRLREQEQEIKRLRRENEELQKKWESEKKKREQAENDLKNLAIRKQSKAPRFPNYSLKEQLRREQSTVKKSTGRRTKADKLKEVTETINVYPEGKTPAECFFSYDRIVTHIRDGRKQVVLYRLHRAGRQSAKLTGVLPATEYGLEVSITLAFLVYELELSFNQASQVLAYFCQLTLSDSEVDSLLKKLAKHWEAEWTIILKLIQLSQAVYIDETGWKFGQQNCFAWILTTAIHTFFSFGESRAEEVLDRLLPRGVFHGIGISDDYRIYEKRFARAQKCWAHPLRKAIRLMLLSPKQTEYREFFSRLLAIFTAGKAIKRRAVSIECKQKLVAELSTRLRKLCTKTETALTKDSPKELREFVNLQKGLMRMLPDLFTFVTVSEVEPTNNRAERGFRKVARARNNYQTSKSLAGCKRRSVLTTVLASLRQNLPEFSLESVLSEVLVWQCSGQSLFARQLATMSDPSP